MSKSTAKPAAEKVKKSRGRTGVIYTWSDGRKLFLANANLKDIHHKGESSISDAVRNGTACWLFDDETLHDIRLKGVRVLGVKVRETGDIWITDLSFVMNRERASFVSGRNGMGYRALPFPYFRRRTGRLRLHNVRT